MKNIGSSTISKKMKNRMRSWATNVPFMPDLEDEQQREERLRVVRLGEVVPRVDDAQHGDERRQREHRQRDAVDADVVAAVDDVDPVLVDVELQRCPSCRSRTRDDRDREAERRERREQRDALDRLLFCSRDAAAR